MSLKNQAFVMTIGLWRQGRIEEFYIPTSVIYICTTLLCYKCHQKIKIILHIPLKTVDNYLNLFENVI